MAQQTPTPEQEARRDEALDLFDHVHGWYGRLMAWDEDCYTEYVKACQALARAKFDRADVKRWASRSHDRLYWHWTYKQGQDAGLRRRNESELNCLTYLAKDGVPPKLVKVYSGSTDFTMAINSPNRKFHWQSISGDKQPEEEKSAPERAYVHGVVRDEWQMTPIHDLARSILWAVPRGHCEIKGDKALQRIADDAEQFKLVRSWWADHRADVEPYLSEASFARLVELRDPPAAKEDRVAGEMVGMPDETPVVLSKPPRHPNDPAL